MVERNPSSDLDRLFAALADPTRRALLQTLSQGPHSVGELAAPFPMSLAAVSKHLQVLERAGLVRREIQGRVHQCRLEAAPMHAGVEWIRHYEQFWQGRLDRLEALLQADNAEQKTGSGSKALKRAPTTRRRKRK